VSRGQVERVRALGAGRVAAAGPEDSAAAGGAAWRPLEARSMPPDPAVCALPMLPRAAAGYSCQLPVAALLGLTQGTSPGDSRDTTAAASPQTVTETAEDAPVLWLSWGRHALVDPELLLLWLPLLVLALWRRQPARIAVPGSATAAHWPRGLRARLRGLPRWLEGLGLALLIFALARPVETDQIRTDISEGVDILLVLDRSGSMALPDLDKDRSRLEVSKAVVSQFARRRMTDTVGASDNVGLLVFARFPELLCPFTLDVAALEGFLSGVRCAESRNLDGTAIGVALAKGVSVLSSSDAKSRVIVLLTDGENTDPEIPPLDAAELAKQRGIRVYTILAGRYLYQQGPFGELVATEQELDSSELEAIAERTGGRFFRARDARQLEGIYSAIEALERTPRREQRAIELTELAPPFAGLGLAFYCLGYLLAATWLRRLLPC
jgi:Ca-activated chloride channel homolog